MEQFTLEKYLADPTRKVVTRDGRDVRIICTNRKSANGNFPVVALVSHDNAEIVLNYTRNGERLCDVDNLFELFFAPQKQSRWVYLYEIHFKDGDTKVYTSSAYINKEIAIANMKKDEGFALTEITWKE